MRPAEGEPYETRSFGPSMEQIEFGRAWVSPDGKRMYFHSRDLPKGRGDMDIWMARWQPKKT